MVPTYKSHQFPDMATRKSPRCVATCWAPLMRSVPRSCPVKRSGMGPKPPGFIKIHEDLFGIYMGIIWDLSGSLCGIYMGIIWDLSGSLCGIYLGFIWEFIWICSDLSGIYLEIIRHDVGLQGYLRR